MKYKGGEKRRGEGYSWLNARYPAKEILGVAFQDWQIQEISF